MARAWYVWLAVLLLAHTASCRPIAHQPHSNGDYKVLTASDAAEVKTQSRILLSDASLNTSPPPTRSLSPSPGAASASPIPSPGLWLPPSPSPGAVSAPPSTSPSPAINDETANKFAISDVIPGHYIVVFKPEAGDAATAAEKVVDEVLTKSRGRVSILTLRLFGVDSSDTQEGDAAGNDTAMQPPTNTPETAPSDANFTSNISNGRHLLSDESVADGSLSADNSTNTTSSDVSGIQAALFIADRRAFPFLVNATLVQALFPDREIVPQHLVAPKAAATPVPGRAAAVLQAGQTTAAVGHHAASSTPAAAATTAAGAAASPGQCVMQEALDSSAITALRPNLPLNWPMECLRNSKSKSKDKPRLPVKLVWRATPCGTPRNNYIRYVSVRALDMASNTTRTTAAKQPCIIRRQDLPAAAAVDVFGTCGMPPKHAKTFATRTCAKTRGSPPPPPKPAASPTPPAPSPIPASVPPPDSPGFTTAPSPSPQLTAEASPSPTPEPVASPPTSLVPRPSPATQPDMSLSPSPSPEIPTSEDTLLSQSPSPLVPGDSPVLSTSPELSLSPSPSPEVQLSPSPEVQLSPSPEVQLSPSPEVQLSPSPEVPPAVQSPKVPSWPPEIPLPSPDPSPSPDVSPLPELPPPSPDLSPSPDMLSLSPSPDPPLSDADLHTINRRLPIVSVAQGEQIPAGVTRIEAVTTNNALIDVSALPARQQAVVAVVDSGLDASHPDLNVVGGRTWVEAVYGLEGDTADATYDAYGHGTHVGGIIGAKNNGQGVAGVAPGTPLYSLKVLDGSGRGTLSAMMDAVKWAAGPAGRRLNIRVINLSVASFADPTSPEYAVMLQYFCAVFREASNAGIISVASAGNYGAAVQGYLPASCPTVAAVTALDVQRNAPAAFSNYLPASAPTSEKVRVFAAPGAAVLSTMSLAQRSVDPSSPYRMLSGTSQAAPHVAAVAATCVMSGACNAARTGIAKIAVLQAAASERLAMPRPASAYGFVGDSLSGSRGTNGRFYGNLVWAKYHG